MAVAVVKEAVPVQAENLQEQGMEVRLAFPVVAAAEAVVHPVVRRRQHQNDTAADDADVDRPTGCDLWVISADLEAHNIRSSTAGWLRGIAPKIHMENRPRIVDASAARTSLS